jgi:hypothetical protein
MDSERFDRVVRGLADGSTRRTALLAGVTTLAASAMAALGLALGAPDADAGKGKKKKKKKKKPPPPGCSGDENYCLDEAPCGPRGSGCECAAGTEGTVCAAPSGGLCFENSDMCETDADCVEFTGAGSVCSAVIGTCICGDVFNTGFNACFPPRGANRAALRRQSASRLGREAASGGK